MFTVNGKAKVLVRYPASFVHCDTFAEVKLEVVRPETVRAPPEFDSPLPKRLLNELPLTMRLVVEAVAKDE